MTNQFCEEYLNSEYKDLCARLICKLARKRNVPFLSGRRDIWSAAVIYALGQINFLFDVNLHPHMSAAELCQRMGTNPSTTSQKAKLIRDLLKLRYFDSEFSTRAVLARNPYMQLTPTFLPCYIKDYPQVRRAQKDLQQKIIHHCVTRPLIDAAGHKLGILDGNYLQLETEDELNVVMDFIIYESWNPPGNAVQQYRAEIGPASDLERKLLDGMLQARASLFEVQAIAENSLSIKDLLQDKRFAAWMLVKDVAVEGLEPHSKIGREKVPRFGEDFFIPSLQFIHNVQFLLQAELIYLNLLHIQ